MNDLLTNTEVRNMLRISAPTLRVWRKNGTLPCIKIGKIVRFKREAVETLLTNQRGENAAI